jgi:putative ATPase
MDLFSQEQDRQGPLAYRMRPRTLDEFVGQEHIVGKGRLLRRVIQADQLSSVIFYGPPGTGKTTLAQVIAKTTKSHFITMNAVLAGVKDLREAIEVAKKNHDLYTRRTILFVDEVHRWNKAQQDALLPWVENGTVIMIGATTENPYFEVNRALVSRSRIFQLKSLTEDDLRAIACATIADAVRGYGSYRVGIADDALDHLVKIANGDARSLLNALELAVETTPEHFPPAEGERIFITREIAEESIQQKVVLYDKEGDYHFDTISAFIKSVRGSDPDATFYWLAKMVRAGEDPHYIFRRMLILASEDVGMADPRALGFVETAAAAFDRVGMPEGRFHLAHAALYLATAPKSNTTLGFFDVLSLLESESHDGEVPNHLRDASRDSEGFGHGEGYMYPHAFRDHWVAQQYLPSGLQGKVFYTPSDQGFEASIRSEVLRKREIQVATALEPPSVEVLTFAPSTSASARWVERIAAGRQSTLTSIRDRIFAPLAIQRHSRILDADAGTGLLLWEALRRAPEGGVWGIASVENASLLEHRMRDLEETARPTIVKAGGALETLAAQEVRFEFIVGRNLFTRMAPAERRSTISGLLRVLTPGGRLSFAQIIPGSGQRLSSLLDWGGDGAGTQGRAAHAPGDGAGAGSARASGASAPLAAKLAAAEERVYADKANPLVSWRAEDLAADCREAGAAEVTVELETYSDARRVTAKDLDLWLADSPYGRALAAGLTSAELAQVGAMMRSQLQDRETAWSSVVAFVVATKKA